MDFRSFVSLLLSAALASGAELPVRTVVLYKHGVGYFERAGNLAAGESARLEFKASEMNDVLKSLTVNDQGGKVTGLRYDSNIPLNQKLSEFPFAIKSGEPLSAVLDQLKGASIDMEFGPQKTSGEIVSARMVPGDKDHPEHEQLTLLMDSGELRNVDLSAASSLRFPDPKLQLQFRDYLAALTGARSKDKRSVYIDSTDSKSRDVRANYIMPMPAWKSSYRLLFDESGQQPTLEGWAIVDNTTDDDWTNVKLTLVSGKPISFISELYDPRYIDRKTADLPEDEAVAPTLHSGAIDMAKAQPRAGFFRPNAGLAEQMTTSGGFAGGVFGGVIGGLPSAAPAPPPPAPSSITPAGVAREIADLFEYDLSKPVTVRKNESAMLPFLQQKIAARKLIIYSDSSRPNPLSAAELTNTSGRTLDGGPITVYDSGAYAGEALVETVKNGDKRFISYGVDLGTRITTNFNSRADNAIELHAHDGMLTTRSAFVEKRTYSVRNADARAKTLVIEHPVRPGYSLVDTAKPVETARDVYRFELKLPATGSLELPVTEEHVYDRQTAVSSLNPPLLLTYIRNKNIPDAARRQLQQIADLKTRIADAESESGRLDTEIRNVSNDEERTRQNITSLSQVSGQQQLVQDYARKLADAETQIAALHARRKQSDDQRAAFQTQLNTAIGKLDF
jgi:hypothetical protein